MIRIFDFLMNMEARRWRALAATLLLFGGMTALFAVGKSQFGLAAEDRLEAWLGGFQHGPWGLFAAVAVFTLSAFVGVPQFILIAACVVAFGPWFGFAYSWVATVASAAARKPVPMATPTLSMSLVATTRAATRSRPGPSSGGSPTKSFSLIGFFRFTAK